MTLPPRLAKTIKSGINVAKSFGFSILEKQPNGDWAVINHNVYGKVLTRCVMQGRLVACRQVG